MIKTSCCFITCSVLLHLQAKLLFGYEILNPTAETTPRRMTNQTSNDNGRSNIDHRNNYCEAHQKIRLGKLSRKDALNGLDVSIGVQPYVIDKKTGKLDENYIAIKVLDEIAKRAKFNFRDSYGVVPEPTGNKTYTDTIMFTVDHYDIAVDWWIRTLERINKGISSNYRWYDSSTIIVTKVKPARPINWLAAFRPFTGPVWIVFVVTMFITGFAYHANDFIMHRRRPENRDRLEANIFKTCMAFMGHVTFEPKFLVNRLLLMSIALLCLVFTAAYTANLASFLVNDNKQERIESFQDVMKYNHRVCVWRPMGDIVAIQFEYPDAIYVEKENEPELYEGLANGECEVALVSRESHTRYENEKEYNPTCDLKVVGIPVRAGTASFAVKSSLDLCSSIVRDVLDIFILEIVEDGTLNRIKKDHYEQGSHDCDTIRKDEEETQRLTLGDFAGILLIHYSLLVITLIIAVLHIMFPNYIKSNIQEISVVRDTSNRLGRSFSANFNRNPNVTRRVKEKASVGDIEENSSDIQLDNKLLRMKSEILHELKFAIQCSENVVRNEAANILKEMQTFQWQNERSF